MEASKYSIIGCLELGLLGQTLMIIISEYLTSHAFPSLKEAASDTMEDSSNGIVTVSRIATTAHICLISILSILVFLSYALAGFIGLAYLGIAFIIAPSFFLAINLFSYLTGEALSFCHYSKDLSTIINYRLSKMNWAAQNYVIFLPILNTSGKFIINLLCIGLFCVIGKVINVIIW
jgi:Na+/H+-translocating membrane pyrophosphatase